MKDKFPNLVDPVTRNLLEKVNMGRAEVLMGNSGTQFKIIGGIPRILLKSGNYADALGQQWPKIPCKA